MKSILKLPGGTKEEVKEFLVEFGYKIHRHYHLCGVHYIEVSLDV